jgi:hypothetical protein
MACGFILETMIDRPIPEGLETGQQSLVERKDDLSQNRQRPQLSSEAIAARIHQLEAWRRQEYHRKRALAWYEALSASIRRAEDLSKDLPAMVQLLWKQYVLGEPNQSQVTAFYASIRSGDRFIIVQTSTGLRRETARIGGFLFQDVREVLDEDAEEVLAASYFRVYAPLAGTQRWYR